MERQAAVGLEPSPDPDGTASGAAGQRPSTGGRRQGVDQACVLSEVRRVSRGPGPREVRRMGHQRIPAPAEPMGHQRRVGERPNPKRQRDEPAFGQVEDPVVEDEVQPDLRVGGGERPERRDNVEQPERHRRVDPQDAAGGGEAFGRGFFGVAGREDRPLGVREGRSAASVSDSLRVVRWNSRTPRRASRRDRGARPSPSTPRAVGRRR